MFKVGSYVHARWRWQETQEGDEVLPVLRVRTDRDAAKVEAGAEVCGEGVTMTDQERAFEAEWKDRDQLYDFPQVKEVARAWHAIGWSRERPKAKPLVLMECVGLSYLDLLPSKVDKWCQDNAIPSGTKIKVTVEEA